VATIAAEDSRLYTFLFFWIPAAAGKLWFPDS
jgi:hypothetical protein